jgi:hypothetical protein
MTPPSPAFLRTVIDRLPALKDQPWLPLAGGRTNRLWRVGQAVIKAYDSAAASPLFPNDPAAEARALELLGPVGLAPEFVGAGDGWLAYAHVDGQVWQSNPAPVARMLARLHQVDPSGFRPAASGSAALLAQAQAIAAAASIAILAGIAVLVGAIAAARQSRIYDSVIMKMLGSTRRQILGAQALEYGILAVVLGLLSLLLGMFAAYYVVVEIFDFSFAPDYSILALTLVGGAGLTFVLGIVGSLPILAARPSEALRSL